MGVATEREAKLSPEEADTMNFTITKHTLRRGLSTVSATLDSRVRNLPSVMLLLAAMIYLLPLSGLLDSDRVAALYGPHIDRGILFVVAFLIFGALTPSWRVAGYVGGFLFVAGRFDVSWGAYGYATPWSSVSGADLLALTCLLIGGVAHMILYLRR